MKKIKYETPVIDNFSTVKFYKYGNTLELTTAVSNGIGILVLPDKKYLVLATGEIKDMDTSAVTRKDNLLSVKQTMRKLRRLIACNFEGGSNQLWVTLTFRDNVTDPKDAYKVFDIFMKRLKRRNADLLYIAIIEPQSSGRWHFHVLLKDTINQKLVISNKDMSSLWGEGFTSTKRLREGDNVANYVLAYLTDLDFYDIDENNSKSKRIVKGARLVLYKKGLRIYRASRNVARPIEAVTSKGDLLEYYEVSSMPNFVGETNIFLDNGDVIRYNTEFYNNV